MKHRKWILLAAVAGAGVVVDQITKYVAHLELRGRGLVPVLDGFLELNYQRNPGAFFSLGAEITPELRRVLFVLASLAGSALILRLYARAQDHQTTLRWALVFLLGGAVGNLIDRAVSGEVIDFVHLYWRDVFDWATFNVADVLITAGLVLLVVDLVKPQHAPAAAPAPAKESVDAQDEGSKRALHGEA
jgi:signal peptidase II